MPSTNFAAQQNHTYCPLGKVLNPKTGRCVKDKSGSKPTKTKVHQHKHQKQKEENVGLKERIAILEQELKVSAMYQTELVQICNTFMRVGTTLGSCTDLKTLGEYFVDEINALKVALDIK